MTLRVTDTNLLQKAQQAEADAELEQAASLYEELIKDEPRNELAYHRLMIIYRKLKQPKDELRIINSGIKAFQQFYQSQVKKRVGRSAKVAQLSKALLKSAGLADKKGISTYDPEPIAAWKKRKALVEKKLK